MHTSIRKQLINKHVWYQGFSAHAVKSNFKCIMYLFQKNEILALTPKIIKNYYSFWRAIGVDLS